MEPKKPEYKLSDNVTIDSFLGVEVLGNGNIKLSTPYATFKVVGTKENPAIKKASVDIEMTRAQFDLAFAFHERIGRKLFNSQPGSKYYIDKVQAHIIY
jgi:hypothetical protein